MIGMYWGLFDDDKALYFKFRLYRSSTEGGQGGVSKTVNSKIQALKTVNSKKFCLKTINSKNYDISSFSHFCVISVISTAHDQSVLWSY